MANDVKKLILLIDDDTSLVLTLSDFLIHEGYDVLTANSGEAGLKQLDDCDPNLIILDMSMPGMGGVGFLKEVTDDQGKPSHPVLVLTARANMADFFANVEVDGFIAKPCDPDDLKLEVGRIIFLRSAERTKQDVEAPSGPPRILLAEDEEDVQKDLTRKFEKEGYDVEVLTQGPQVLERAVVEKPSVIVLKRVLENMNGDTVAEMLSKLPTTQDVPVVLYDESASGVADVNRFKGSRSGIDQFIVGNDTGEILRAVQKIVKST